MTNERIQWRDDQSISSHTPLELATIDDAHSINHG